MALILCPEDSKAWRIPTGSRLCSTASPPRRKTKTKLPVFPYQALLNNVSLLGLIKQECRSQIKPEATEKTTPAGGLAHPPPQGELIKKKKKKAWLPFSLSPTSPPPPLPPKSIPRGKAGSPGRNASPSAEKKPREKVN